MKLIKLIYLSERESVRSRGRPMIFDEFYSLKDGPISLNALNGINGNTDIGKEEIYSISSGIPIPLRGKRA